MTTTSTPNSASEASNGQAPSSTSAILRISPQTFQFTASKVSSGLVSKLKIKNLHATHVGYKFKTNAPLRYSVKPVLGVLAPGQSIEVFVRCESWVNPQDRFLLQSVSLTEHESQHIDAVTWKEIDRRRLLENFIQCSSSSTLSMREPQDDGGSLSSSSNCSSGSSSLRTSSTRSGASRQQHLQHLGKLQQQQQREPSVAHVHAAAIAVGRRLSASSTTSSTTSSPGSYPTLFTAKGSSQPPRSSYSSTNSTVQGSKGTSPGYMATTFSNSRQTLRTVTRFLAIRQYTKTQVLTVSLVCLLLGLLLPLEKVFLMASGSASSSSASSTSATSAQFKSGFVGKKADGSPFSSASSASFGALPILVTAQAAAAAQAQAHAAAAAAKRPVVAAPVVVVEGSADAAAEAASVFEEVRLVSDVEGAV